MSLLAAARPSFGFFSVSASALLVLVAGTAGCATTAESATDSASAGLHEDFGAAGLQEGSREARAVLALVNDRARSAEDFQFGVRIGRATAEAIVATRNGPNNVAESRVVDGHLELGGDDDNFERLVELDSLPGSDVSAFIRLKDFAIANGYLPPQVPCDGQLLSGANGEVTSPNWPGVYDNGTDRTWCIEAPSGRPITLGFSDFSTEGGYDFVELRDSKGSILSNTSGANAPAPVTSTRIYVRFRTDGSGVYGGWRATWTSQ